MSTIDLLDDQGGISKGKWGETKRGGGIGECNWVKEVLGLTL